MKLKKWLPVLLAGLLLWPAARLKAQESEPGGTLTLELTEDGDRDGVRFSLEQVASLRDGRYELLEPYEKTGIDINSLGTAADLEQAAATLADEVSPDQSDIQLRTDSQGIARTALDMGVWLVRQTDGAGYGWIAPFLCAIPSWDLAAGDMTWDTVVQPKRTPFPRLVVEKVDESGRPVTGQDFRFVLERDGQSLELPADPATGTVSVDLRWGSGRIREDQAPAGFVKSSRVIQVNVADGITVDGEPVQAENGVIRIRYENRRQPAAAGRTPTAMMSGQGIWMAGLGAAAALGVVFVLLRKQQCR
ncbi:collagen binding domain-containing protein [uncultured Faecalibaculum sp.]|nr:hypothetical protein [uncultured Faecalibaculum sp.]